MLMITRRAGGADLETPIADRLTLPFDVRSRSRFRAMLVSGTEVGVVLERGQVLRDGERLLCDDGRVVEVRAAKETVTTVFADDAGSLLRIAFHLGNRHVALQIGDGWVRYSHDHVLDEMVIGLGARILIGSAPFEPENGAYHGESGAHGHSHAHDRSHAHDHSRAHDHAHSEGHAHSIADRARS